MHRLRPRPLLAAALALLVAGPAGWAWDRAEGDEQAIRRSLAAADAWLEAGRRGDIRAALELSSRSVREQESGEARLKQLFSDRRELLKGYASLERETYGATVRSGAGGKRVKVQGKVSSAEGPVASFEAEFVREGGDWKVASFEFLDVAGS